MVPFPVVLSKVIIELVTVALALVVVVAQIECPGRRGLLVRVVIVFVNVVVVLVVQRTAGRHGHAGLSSHNGRFLVESSPLV
jgi:hypothetical protein